MTNCTCGNIIEINARGRKRLYCSNKCRRKADHKPKWTVKCAWRECKRMVTRGERGRAQKFCCDHCRYMYNTYK